MGAEKANGSAVLSALSEYLERTFLVRFGEGGLTTTSNLFDHGVIDSYGLVEMVEFIESRFGVHFSDEELLSPKLATLDGIAEMVSVRMGAAHGDAAVQP
jgi:acyl carrier protein